MYKCPFCKSTNCDELSLYELPEPIQPDKPFLGMRPHSYNDNLVEFICNDCGIVTKIDPMIYKGLNQTTYK